ncbi:mitochondrial NAD transporter [Russula earlei]|uniref:Mitochondrial NAD transporter n=1 Tax=Russula earlei TaxID=71964 RepID=A0ACC0UED3_9AGAM|nr:mitochondrial NAD transporter [Russula earlei]
MPSKRKKWTADSVIAGAGGGFVASIATCPLDVVKTKLQAQRATLGQADYLGISGTFRNIIRHDGFRGLYRGLGPTILGYLPTWAIYFRQRLYPAPSAKGYQPTTREHGWSLHILSAMAAGATSTICTNPLWVIKTRFMTQSRDETRFRHTLDAAITIYRSEGIRAFYRGLLPALLGIAHVAVQFPLYEQLKIVAQRHSPDRPLSALSILFCSAVAKMTASVATYPHEVVRTRLQTRRQLLLPSGAPRKRSGVIRTTRKIIHFEGWRGLYKGLSVNLIRTVPNSAVTMLTYELLMRHLAARGS